MKKTISIILAAVLALGCIFGFAACSSGSKGITIAVPNDATNEARALLLLQEQGIIKLKDGAGITARLKPLSSPTFSRMLTMLLSTRTTLSPRVLTP